VQLRLASSARERLTRSSEALLLAAAILAQGCHRATPAPDVGIAMETVPQPARAGLTTVVFRLTDALKHPVTGARVEVEGDMSHPGMAPVFGSAREAAPGRYTSQLRLTMAGDWVILFHITLAEGQKLEKEMALPGVRN